MTIDSVALTAGMRANLISMQQTEKLLERTQGRLATGLKVQSALDDPINFFAARGHTQRAGDLAARKDGMSEGIQLLKAADAGIEGVLDLIAAAKSLAQSALSAETSTEITSLETQYNAMLTQIDDLADDSGYKGVNLLGGTTETLTVYFDESGNSSITLDGFDGSSITGLSLAAVTGTWNDGTGNGDQTAIDADIDLLDTARTTLRTQAKTFSNNMSTVTIRQEFTTNMIATLQDGAANLTEADMNEEGANMLMLQTRQALGTTSLSIASQAAQSVLRLF